MSMTNTPTVVLGRNIRAEMARRGIRQHQLAKHLGMSQSSLSKRLRGDIPLNVNDLNLIAVHLGVDPASLLAEPMGAAS